MQKEDLSPQFEAILGDVPPTEELAATVTESKTPLKLDKDFLASFLKTEFIEDVLEAMEEEDVSRSELARRTGKTRQHVSQLLSEKRNFTLDTMAELCAALGRVLSLSVHHQDEWVQVHSTSRFNVFDVPPSVFSRTGEPPCQPRAIYTLQPLENVPAAKGKVRDAKDSAA